LSGLSREQAMSGGAHVQFQLKRDAGAFNFEGWFKDGNGSGHFIFAPDRSFAAQLNAQGFGFTFRRSNCFRLHERHRLCAH